MLSKSGPFIFVSLLRKDATKLRKPECNKTIYVLIKVF